MAERSRTVMVELCQRSLGVVRAFHHHRETAVKLGRMEVVEIVYCRHLTVCRSQAVEDSMNRIVVVVDYMIDSEGMAVAVVDVKNYTS